jgi:hypothetical protein
MSEDHKERLLAAVTAANQSSPVKFDKPLSVEVGQVRRLRSYDDDLDTVLVLVMHVDEDFASANVIGAGSPVDGATTRDLVVSRATSGFPFDLFLRVGGVATAWTVQLSGTPVVGSLPIRIVNLARRAPQMASHELAAEAEAVGISTGSLRPQKGDPLWWQIGRTAEHLARLTDACHEAMLSQTIADPAILPSLILRGDEIDRSAALALSDAVGSESVVLTAESWDSFGEALSDTKVRDPDVMRLLERGFLQGALHHSAMGSPVPTAQVEEPTKAPARNIPTGLARDPLSRLVARCAHSGERSTRIATSGHLWAEDSCVFHTTVGGHRHAILAEFDIFEEVGA